MPVAPAKREVRNSATVLPIGVMHPRPVTTTRFTSSPCGALVIVDSLGGLAYPPPPPEGYFVAKVLVLMSLRVVVVCKILHPKGLGAKYSIERG